MLKNFPEFVDEMKPGDLQPYILFGDFGTYIRNLIDKSNYNEKDINNIFTFLNKMGESSDKEVHNLLTVGILEIIIDSSKATMLAKQNLKGEALIDLDLIQKFCSNK